MSLFLPQLYAAATPKRLEIESSSYKIDYVIVIKNFLNPEGHQNPFNGSKVTAILLNGQILPIGGASAVEGLRSTGLPRLVYIQPTLLGLNFLVANLRLTNSQVGQLFNFVTV